EARLALDAGDDVVRQRDPLVGRAQHELARVEDERVALGDLDLLGEVGEVALDVDDRHRVVEEAAEQLVEPQVDRRGLHARLVQRFDGDAAGGELLADGAVRQDHRPTTLVVVLVTGRGVPCPGAGAPAGLRRQRRPWRARAPGGTTAPATAPGSSGTRAPR